jgi:UDP-3-O-[3-hydroxymyristoyl] glucosamine N-acyltransferase
MEDEAGGRGGGLLMAVAMSFRDLEELLGIEISGDDRIFTGLASFEDARAGSIVFAENEAAVARALESAAGLILVPLAAADGENARLLAVKHPKYVFAVIGRWFDELRPVVVHSSARIEDGAVVGEGTSVGAGSVIAAGAVVGARCVIGMNVTIHTNTRLGDGCVVQSGAVLGSTGFGYVRGEDGRYVRFPQQGRLLIGDDVEIGANSTIDRGALGETRIGRGTKIDNLVHIGHNCTIGEDVIMAAQVGIAGSTEVGDGAILAGQVGLAEHVVIGPGVIVGAQGGVPTSKRIFGKGEVFWGTPARPIREYLKDLARLRRASDAERPKASAP